MALRNDAVASAPDDLERSCEAFEIGGDPDRLRAIRKERLRQLGLGRPDTETLALPQHRLRIAARQRCDIADQALEPGLQACRGAGRQEAGKERSVDLRA